MKVREMIEQLRKLDQDIELFCYVEDDESTKFRGGPWEILEIFTVNATRGRHEDGTPFLRFENAQHSERVALIEITADF